MGALNIFEKFIRYFHLNDNLIFRTTARERDSNLFLLAARRPYIFMSYIISYIQVFLISTAPGFELHFLIILDMQFHLGDATHLEAESNEREGNPKFTSSRSTFETTFHNIITHVIKGSIF